MNNNFLLQDDSFEYGNWMYDLAARLFPICRSITGNGFRESLSLIKEHIPELSIHEVPSGTQVFDWTVPKEWNITDAYIEDSNCNRIVDFKENNLHVLGYSAPVDKMVSLQELLECTYVEESQPDAIPYVTSYYKERYGFCMSKNQRDFLKDDMYHIVINSTLTDGSLTYGEYILPGETSDEIFFSTYLCHPSMANNELSGPVLAAALIKWLSKQTGRKYTYRFIFIPETIGSITYLSKNLATLKENVKAGYVLSCVGDDRTFSYIPSKYGNTLADRVATNVLNYYYPDYHKYSFLDRGSDERQYNSPGIDLPVCVVCRSKYGVYPEYHTSLDNMNLISPKGLNGSFQYYIQVVQALEYNGLYQVQCLCEPQLGKRGLYPTISHKGSYDSILAMRDFLAFADGTQDLIGISNSIHVPISELVPIISQLLDNNLIIRL